MDKLNTEAMSHDFLHYKNEFLTTLDPIIDLLEYKKSQLPLKDWEKFMNSTKARIISNPEQFLGKDYPREFVRRQLVLEIFADFFEKENVEI